MTPFIPSHHQNLSSGNSSPGNTTPGTLYTNRTLTRDNLTNNNSPNPQREDASNRYNIGLRFASNQRERISLALDFNKIYDKAPTQQYTGKTKEQIMNLRARQQEKEIGPPSFRFSSCHVKDKIGRKSVVESKEILRGPGYMKAKMDELNKTYSINEASPK